MPIKCSIEITIEIWIVDLIQQKWNRNIGAVRTEDNLKKELPWQYQTYIYENNQKKLI